MALHILDVGQCGFDGPRMERLWHERLGARVSNANDLEETRQALKKHKIDVVLVNRVLAYDGSSGLELIKTLIDEGEKTPILLVSDREDSQKEAVSLGAKHGFGKADLGDPKTLELVQQVAGKKD